jgi:hypothetical protein
MTEQAHHHEHRRGGGARDHVVSSLHRLALSATLHCLTGCGIGEVLGLVIATAAGWSNASAITLAVVLGLLLGYCVSLPALLEGGIEEV